ncbi:AMP-binding protein [Mycobacterium sp. THU-M116]
MQSEQRLREELAGVLRDAGLGQIDDPDILDLDFEEQLGLGSIELADLLIRVGGAYAVELPADGVGRFRRPRDVLEAVDQALGAGGAATGRPAVARLPQVSTRDASISNLSQTLPEASNLLDLLRFRAVKDGRHPHLKFLTADGHVSVLDFGELWDRGRRAAAGLANLGLGTGDRVAIVALTGPDFFVAFVAALCAGGVPVPIYPPVRLDELDGYVRRQSRILRSAGAAFIVSDPQFKGAAELLCRATPSLRESATVDSLTGGAGSFCVESPCELALIQYTSGSTGDPKGVALTHANLMANIRAISEMTVRAGLRPSDVAVSWMPLYHDFGLIGSWMGVGLCTGVTIVMMSPVDFLTKPASWLWAIDRFRANAVATTTFGLNHVTRRVSDDHIAGVDLSSITFAALGAEPIRVSALDDFCRRFEPYGFQRSAFTPAYGLAETCVAVTFALGGPRVDNVDADRLAVDRRAVPAGPGSRIRSLVSVGTPIGDQQVRVVDATGQGHEPIAERNEGRVLIRGKSVMAGYFGRPEATAAVRMGDWLDTGDLGYLADGELFITGRVKDLIIKAGRNYHPQDIEQAVGDLPGVRKGCVIAFGEEMPEHGEGIVVVAETAAEAGCHDELKALIRAAVVETTGTSADDVMLVRRGSVLKTSSGKLRRQETRQAYRDRTLGKSTAGRWRSATTIARLGWYRARTVADRCRQSVVGAYIAGMTMLVVLIFAGSALWVRGRAGTWRFARRTLRLWFAATGMSFRRTGVPLPDGQALYVSNHPTDMDPLLLVGALDRPVSMTGKARLFTGLFGVLAERLGVIALDPGSVESSLASYERMQALLREDVSIHIFPEGERRDTPGIYPFRLGAFKLAASTGIPIVPLALKGPREVMRGRPYRSAALEVEVLPAVRLACDPSDLAALAQGRTEIRRMIADATGEPLVDSRGLKKPVVRDSVVTRFTTWGGRSRSRSR